MGPPVQYEIRVGAFLVTAVVVAIGFILALGRVSLGGGTPLCADFAYLGGLQAGAPVMVSGVKVGQVRRITLLNSAVAPPPAATLDFLGRHETPLVRACTTIDEQAVPLVNDATVLAVATQGVIGEAYLELEPRTGGPLAPNQVLRDMDAPRLHVMTLQAAALMAVAGDVLRPSDTHASSQIGKAVAALLSTVNGVLTERRPAIVTMLENIAAASGDVRAVAAGLKNGIGDGAAIRTLVDQSRGAVEAVQRELPPVAERGEKALASLQALGDRANHALDGNALAAIIADSLTAAKHLEQFSADAEHIIKEVRRGEGTLGGLVQDPQLYDDLKELLRDLKRHPWKFLWRD